MPRVGTTGASHTVDIGDRSVLRLDDARGRITVHLLIPGIDASVDISASPATAALTVEDAATRASVPLSQARAQTIAGLRRLGDVAEVHVPGDVDLVTALGAAAFPLLGEAYDLGTGPLGAIPPWAAPVLDRSGPRVAAQRAFGTSATRPVVSALARSLVRCGTEPVDLSRLALALIGRDTLEPDHLAALLTAEGSRWTADTLPTPDGIARARRAVRRWGGRLSFGYLTEAAADPHGHRLFDECVRFADDLGPHGPLRPPTRLRELRDVYRLAIRTAPTTPLRRPVQPTRPRPTGAAQPQRPVHYPPLLAPRAVGEQRSTQSRRRSTTIPTPRWLASVEGTSVGGFDLVLPHSTADLTRWGQTMANCLGTYRDAAARGISHLVGVTRSGNLRYVIEITPQRTIRQFSGPANRPVSRHDHDIIVAHLRTRGMVR